MDTAGDRFSLHPLSQQVIAEHDNRPPHAVLGLTKLHRLAPCRRAPGGERTESLSSAAQLVTDHGCILQRIRRFRGLQSAAIPAIPTLHERGLTHVADESVEEVDDLGDPVANAHSVAHKVAARSEHEPSRRGSLDQVVNCYEVKVCTPHGA